MTLNELQKWMLNNDVSDSWWVAIDGEVLDNLMALPDVGKIKDQHPVALVAVLHESKADDEDPEWIPFQKNEGARFKVVSSRFDNLQVRVPAGAEKTAHDLPAKVEAHEEEERKKEDNKKDEAKPAEKAPKGEKAEKSKEATTAGADAAEMPVAVQAQLEAMRKELETLKSEVASLQQLANELKRPILEAHKILEERERFLEMSETSLFDKAQKQEVLQTELEQLSEELHTREADLKEREAALQG